ncbi:MAG: type I-B CRISPR-associated protein Cas8b1/Cst1 [Bacillota bacterium]
MKELFLDCRQINPSDNSPAGFKYTNNDMIDYGLDTVICFCKKEYPEDLTYGDLKEFSDILGKCLLAPGLTGQHSVYYTMNFGAVNPSAKSENKAEFAAQVARSYLYESEEPNNTCIYCGRPAIIRGFRNLIPMLTGEGVINFFPYGDAGFPICGPCLFAVMSLTVGAPMISGRMLYIGCNLRVIVQEFIRAWLDKFSTRLQMAIAAGDKLEKIGSPLSRVGEVIFKVERLKDEINEDHDLKELDVRVYHLTNSGQGPAADIYYLPMSVVRFARIARKDHNLTWSKLIKQGRQLPDKKAPAADSADFPRNYFYEDLFRLPERSAHFIRTYLLRQALRRGGGKSDPRVNYNSLMEAELVSWGLVELFLKEVTGMEQARIKVLRELGDAIADHIMITDDRALFGRIYRINKFGAVRMLLLKMSRDKILKGDAPVVSFDGFITAFEEGEELARIDWHLAWDLVIIRLIEILHQKGWLQKNKEELMVEQESEIDEAEG